MTILENLKRTAERVTGWRRPSARDLRALVRARKPHCFWFEDDGVIPNNPELPVVLYRTPVRLAGAFDPAAVFEDLFERNGWGDSWRDGIYDYVHYHSRVHEVLGIARGRGRVQLGGPRGRTFALKAGDAVMLPAGTGHQCLGATKNFLVVGAYPPFGKYDECTTREHDRAVKTIPKVARPRKDPVYGAEGALVRLWRKR